MKYSALKGVQDIMPPDIYIWQRIESSAKQIFHNYGFQEIRLPIIESTDIFVRSIGETSDIVGKEMYTFPDKANRSVTLRPEGTACAVRCYVEHNLRTLPSPQKFFYTGPMFRYERPQKGRFRQFYQIGVEAFGSAEPSQDAEIIVMLKRFLEQIGIREQLLKLTRLETRLAGRAIEMPCLRSSAIESKNFAPIAKTATLKIPCEFLTAKLNAV